MRIKNQEINIIKRNILKYIQDAKIMLFGSRVDDTKKGGDIDIYIETQSNITLKQKLRILADIEIQGVDRKVDLLFKTPSSKEQNIFKTIYKEGIVL